MLRHLISTICFYLIMLYGNGQMPVWVLGNSQQTSAGSFYTLGPGNLKFFNVNFSGASPTFTSRTLGMSVNNIISMGTQDVINNALDASDSVLFYLFAASQTPYNISSSPIDTVYFVAPSSSTGADEVFGKVVAESRISSVIEHGLCKKPGTNDQFYFVYKTRAGSSALDDVRYVTVNTTAKTVSTPINLKNDENTSEGFAITPYDCISGKQWVYTATIHTGGNLRVWKYEVTSSGILPPILAYTITITGNSSVSVIGGIEVSPQGDKLALCNYNAVDDPNKEVIVFDLDISTGNLSGERWYKNPSYPLVACEFSNDGSQIYMLQSGSGSFPSKLYHRPVISSGSYTLVSGDALPLTLSAPLALERAADGKIYGIVSPNEDNFYYVDNIDSPTPTVGYTPSMFYGSVRIGDGLPDLTDEITGSTVLSISGTSSICQGDSVLLIATGGSDYIWSGGSTSTNDSIYISPITTTQYIVNSSDACSLSDSITVVVNPVPLISVAPFPDSICSGQTITITAAGAESYSWTGGISASGASISVSPTSTTTYYVTGTSSGCTGDTDTVTVAVVSNPGLNISGDTVLCAGESTTLSVPSGVSIQWTGGSSDTSSSITVSPAVTTLYGVYINGSSCYSSDSVTVIVNPIPLVTITGTDSICEGETITLTAATADSYSWTGGITASTSSIIIAPSSTTTYFVSGTSLGCTSPADTFTVTVISVPVVTITGDTIICEGETTILSTAGASPIQWTGGSAATTSSIAVSPPANTIYGVYINGSFCPASDSVTVIVNPLPILSSSGPDTVCSGEQVIFTANGGTTFSWTGGMVSSNDSLIFNASVSSTYFVTTTSPDGCTSETDTLNLVVFASSNATITGNMFLCVGETANLSVSSPGSIQWSGGISSTSSSISVTPSVNTTYIVTVTNGICIDDDTVTVFVSPFIDANFSYDQDLCSGLILFTGVNGPFSYDWNFGDSTGSGTGQMVYYSFIDTGIYQVQLIVNEGSACVDTVVMSVHSEIAGGPHEPLIPNIFTPNGDGINDAFENKDLCLYDRLVIYDRWGVKVFETNNPLFEFWDGKYKGEEAVQGVYYYIFTHNGSNELKGHVTLSR